MMIMTDDRLLEMAQAEGFSSALIDPKEIPVDETFRKFCEDNLCGQYNANYSCPPVCGTVEQMHQKLLKGTRALVLKSQWPIESYQDTEAIVKGKHLHNQAMLRLNEELRKLGYHGLCVGGSCCSLCDACKMAAGEACAYPDKRFSCMSAYCVDVGKLAKKCGMELAWVQDKLSLFGMIVLHKDTEPLGTT